MIAAFDGSILTAGPPTGVARAFATSLAAYRSIHDDPIAVLVPRVDRLLDGLVPDGCEVVEVAAGNRARQRQWPSTLRSLRADLLHAPVAAVPMRAPVPTVATLHDLPWMHPHTRAEPAARWRYRLAARLALERANAVVVPSAATAADVRRWRPRHRAPLRVIPHGHADGPRAADDRAGPFLVLGDDRPRKNRARTAEAHRRARSRCPDLPAIEWIGPPDHWLSEEAKHARLATCRGLLHFSLLEGFGLPVLEALAAGCPIACSDLPAHREIAGDTPIYVDPCDVEAMAEAIVRLHVDDPQRSAQQWAGPRRAALFTPTATAQAWRALHDELVGGRA